MTDYAESSRKRSVAPVVCRMLGALLLVAAIGLAVVFVVPVFQGYEVRNVVAESPEASIPQGSAVFIEACEPSYLVAEEVVAYEASDGAAVGRVAANRSRLNELMVTGVEYDVVSIPYKDALGRVERSVPQLGVFAESCASLIGIVYLVLTAACGVMLFALAGHLQKRNRLR